MSNFITATAGENAVWVHRFQKAEQREKRFSHETFENFMENGQELPTDLELA